MTAKKILGQYFTGNNHWLEPQIKEFINSSGATIAYDPFAGNGDLLKAARQIGFKKIIGLDIDPRLGFKINNSLIKIPKLKNSIIITNPPYLTKYSAKRKNILTSVSRYFKNNHIVDLYQLAIRRCLEAADYVVAIIPETFINNIFSEDRIASITILEKNPFLDTENPVCVVCFDNKIKRKGRDFKIFKDDKFVNYYSEIKKHQLKPQKNYKLNFNLKHGQVALRAVDMPNPIKPIEFMPSRRLDYSLDKIKYSSRLITIIEVQEEGINFEKLTTEANKILNLYRKKTQDILLSPFKGNNKLNIRRRRLDYRTARAIIELAVCKQKGGTNEQFRLL